MRRRRFPWVLLAASAAALASLPAIRAGDPPAPAADEAAAPRLEVEATEIDLGKVVRGKDATASFVLRNTGSETLRILSAKPG